jgi:hypothetical protein
MSGSGGCSRRQTRAAGRGGLAVVSRVTGMAQTTVRRGFRDLDAGEWWERGRVRQPGAGRPSVIERDPGVERALDGLLEPVTVGDPERVSVRWTSKSAAKLAEELRAMGHDLVDRTVLRLLKGMGLSMQGNYKTRERSDHPDRGAQFTCINETVAGVLAAGQPVISAVYARLDEGEYPTKVKVTNAELADIEIERHAFHGDWNYIVYPHHQTQHLFRRDSLRGVGLQATLLRATRAQRLSAVIG